MTASTLQAALSASFITVPAPLPRTPVYLGALVGLVLLLAVVFIAWRIDRSRRSTIRALRRRIDWLTEVQNYAVPSLVLDDALRALHANQAAVELLGYDTPAEVLEAWDRETVLELSPLRQALPTLRSQEGGRMLDLAARRRDGTQLRLAVRLHPLGPDLCVVAFADLSEMIAERERMERMARLEVMGRLAGSVAHDFNNVLAIILAHTDFLEDAVAGDEMAEEGLREIRSSARDAAQIVKQLLAIGRRGSEKLRVVDLNQLLRSSERMIRSSLGESVAFELVIGEDRLTVRVDASTFRQALLNLAINARDAMQQRGRFTIETHLSSRDPDGGDEYVEILASDTGSGMSAEVQERIFEPFFTTKSDDRGTGLGLATVYATVTGASGTIDVDSTPGHGTTFTIRLPRARPDRPADGRPGSASAAATPPDGPPRTILVVDDEAPLRRLIVRALERHGHRVLSAEDGRQAIQLATRHPGPIHLLLTDVRMGVMSGPVAAGRIREIRPDIRVIFMTGYAEEDELEPIPPGEAPDILPKPFDVAELLERVADALTESDAPADSAPSDPPDDRSQPGPD
ncbi:MAG: response regulator [Gemmatimonadota bacterium]